MSNRTIPIVKLTIVTILFSVIEVFAFTFLAMVLLAMGFANAMGAGVSDNPFVSFAAPLLALVGLVLSTLICPLVAVLFRKTIAKATPNTDAQFLIFFGMCVLPVPLFFVGQYSGLVDRILLPLFSQPI